jgi:ribosomal protein S18 acetylase RimI-like enzyme
MVGFIAGEYHFADGKNWIATLGVLPEYRRRGIATALLQACEDQMTLPRIRLTVRAENFAAQQLYKDLGYLQIGMWKKYYHGGADALLLEKVKH